MRQLLDEVTQLHCLENNGVVLQELKSVLQVKFILQSQNVCLSLSEIMNSVLFAFLTVFKMTVK